MRLPVNAVIYMKLVAVAAIWGATFVAGRVVSSQMPPLAGASARFLVATAALAAVVWLRYGGLPRLSSREMAATAALGFTGILLYNLGFFYALRDLPASRASLLVALNPAVTLLGAILFLGEALTVRRLAGLALAFFGAAVVLTRGHLASVMDGAAGWPEAAMLGAVCSWAAYTLIGRGFLQGQSAITATVYAAIWGTIFLLIATLAAWQPVPASAVRVDVAASVAFIGLFGTALAFVWYSDGVTAIGASRAAVFTNLVPVFAVGLGALFLGEPVLPSMVIGGALTLAGVVLANTGGDHPTIAAPLSSR
jgi:drug/metabolite transporter (DMT)-like permease